MTDQELRKKALSIVLEAGRDMTAKDATTAILELFEKERAELERLQKKEKEVFDNPDKWMRWCDNRLLDMNEAQEKEIADLQAKNVELEEKAEYQGRMAVELFDKVKELKATIKELENHENSQITDLKAKVDLAREALKPFADSDWYYTWTQNNTNAKAALEKLVEK